MNRDSTRESEPSQDVLALPMVLGAARRRWWLIALAVIAVVGYTGYREYDRVPVYTAEAMLQRQTDVSPLQMVGLASSRASDGLAGQAEILRSRAVLEPVVQALGLQVTFRGTELTRTELLDSISVSRDVRPGSYEVRRDGDGFVLRSLGTGMRLDESGDVGWLVGSGFRFRLNDSVELSEPIRVSVDLTEAVVNGLKGGIRVDQESGTNLLKIRYSHPDPTMAAAVVNETAVSFQHYSARQAREAATRRREFISDQLAQVADSLARAQSRLLAYQDSAQMLSPELESQAVSNQLMDRQAELRSLRFQEGVLDSFMASLESGEATSDSFSRILALGSDVLPAAQSMYERLQSLQSEREGLTASRFGMTEQRPEVERLDSLISKTRAEIRSVTRQSLELLRDRIASVEETVNELQAEVGDLPGQATRYSRFKQQVDAAQQVFDLLLEKYYEAQIAEAVEAGEIEVVSSAAVPLSHEPLNQRRNVAFSLLIGLALGLGGAVLLESMDTTIRSVDQAERASGLAFLGAIPEFAGSNGTSKAPQLLDIAANTAAAEAFRMLRTSLRYARADRPSTVMITSAEPGVGKSTLALNLAQVLASQPSKVLLIDADLRRPQLHTAVGVEREPGLSDHLVGEASVQECLRFNAVDGVPELTILPCGSSVPNPAELVGTERFRTLLTKAREHFDFVLVDAPPVLVVSDPSLIAEAVEGLLVVASVGSSHRAALAGAVDRLRQTNTPLLGVILNRVTAGRMYGVGGGYGGYMPYYGSDYYTSNHEAGNGGPGGKGKRGILSRLPGLSRRS